APRRRPAPAGAADGARRQRHARRRGHRVLRAGRDEQLRAGLRCRKAGQPQRPQPLDQRGHRPAAQHRWAARVGHRPARGAAGPGGA
nr:hypothetical protein [Tanacetum cinerariifolium]